MPRLRFKKGGKVEWWLMVHVRQRNCINLIGGELERPFPENQVAENTACSVSDWWNVQGFYVRLPPFRIFKISAVNDPWHESKIALYFVLAYSLLRLTTGWTVRDRIPVGTKFSDRPDRPWGPPSLLCNEYRIFPGGKVRPGRAADHSPPSSAAVMEE